MIHDGYWQMDLISYANKILYWKRHVNKLIDRGLPYSHKDMEKALHKLTQMVFFSACIVRKMVEEEIEAIEAIKKYAESFSTDQDNIPTRFFKLYNQTIDSLQLPLLETSINFFEDYCCEDYDFSLSNKRKNSIKSVSNWILHSYVWNLQSENPNSKHISGFVVSSDYDKSKFACYVSLDSWCDMLKFCGEYAYL